jgi:hypothetical protein
MTDDEIKSLLAAARTPQPDASTLRTWADRAWRDAHQAAPAAQAPAVFRRFNAWSALLWGMGGAALASVVFSFFLFHQHPPAAPPIASMAVDADRNLLHEVSAVFPGRLSAIIEQGGAQELQLAENTGAFMSQPVALELDRGSDHLRVLSFSGQCVSLKLDGKTVRVEILLDEHNQVLVLGNDTVLLPRPQPAIYGYRLTARPVQTL